MDIYLFTQNSQLYEILHQLHIHAFDEVIKGNAIYIDPSIIIESVRPYIGSMWSHVFNDKFAYFLYGDFLGHCSK